MVRAAGKGIAIGDGGQLVEVEAERLAELVAAVAVALAEAVGNEDEARFELRIDAGGAKERSRPLPSPSYRESERIQA